MLVLLKLVRIYMVFSKKAVYMYIVSIKLVRVLPQTVFELVTVPHLSKLFACSSSRSLFPGWVKSGYHLACLVCPELMRLALTTNLFSPWGHSPKLASTRMREVWIILHIVRTQFLDCLLNSQLCLL